MLGLIEYNSTFPLKYRCFLGSAGSWDSRNSFCQEIFGDFDLFLQFYLSPDIASSDNLLYQRSLCSICLGHAHQATFSRGWDSSAAAECPDSHSWCLDAAETCYWSLAEDPYKEVVPPAGRISHDTCLSDGLQRRHQRLAWGICFLDSGLHQDTPAWIAYPLSCSLNSYLS